MGVLARPRDGAAGASAPGAAAVVHVAMLRDGAGGEAVSPACGVRWDRAAAGCRIDAAPTWRLIEDMLAHGHTRSGIARLLGSQARNPALQLGRSRISVAKARQVEEIYRLAMSDVLEKRARNLASQQAHRERRRAG